MRKILKDVKYYSAIIFILVTGCSLSAPGNDKVEDLQIHESTENIGDSSSRLFLPPGSDSFIGFPVETNYPAKSAYIIVYEHANYKGRKLTIRRGQNLYRLRSYNFNNKISSIKCFNGAELTIYQHDNCRGESMTILDSISNLQSYDFNDTVSSISWSIPISPFVIAYKHANFKGRAITITRDMNQLPLDNTISSVKVYNAGYVYLYENPHYKGDYIRFGKTARYVWTYNGRSELHGQISDLSSSDWNFNDKASSITIEKH